MTVGVLAFHGDVAEHIELLQAMKQKPIEVRSVDDLQKISHLILPGGESTVMSRFLSDTGLGDAIRKRVGEGSLAIYGTCAGAILVARKVTGKNVPSPLGLIDITVNRNAYGTQVQSFEGRLTFHVPGKIEKHKIKRQILDMPVSFIRAPIITKIGKGVEVLSTHDGHPVLVKQGRILAGTFHPEVRGQSAIHKLFLKI